MGSPGGRPLLGYIRSVHTVAASSLFLTRLCVFNTPQADAAVEDRQQRPGKGRVKSRAGGEATPAVEDPLEARFRALEREDLGRG